MTVPEKFRTKDERNIISYDYIDTVTGNGYIKFYLAQSNTGSSVKYLTTQRLDSQTNSITVSGTTTAPHTFDSTFQVPARINGDSYFNYSTASGGGSTITVTFTVYHVDSEDVATSIGTATSPARAGGVIARENLLINLTKTNFVIGDKLRVIISLAHVGGNPSTFYCDPTSINSLTETVTTPNRTIGTDAFGVIPFKIDL